MHENSDLQNSNNVQQSDNVQPTPPDQGGEQPEPHDQDKEASTLIDQDNESSTQVEQEKEQPLPSTANGSEQVTLVQHDHQASPPAKKPDVFLVSMYVTDEELAEARSLLTAWVPDVPISIFVITSKDSHVAYFENHLASDDTFTLTIVKEPQTLIQPGHIYVLSANTSYKLQDSTLQVYEDSQKELIPGESFLVTYARAKRSEALVILFTQSIADYSSIIKKLTNLHASVIHHSQSGSTSPLQTELPIRHLVDRSVSIRQVAVYTQRFIESFNPNVISVLDKDPQSLSYVQHIGSLVSDHSSFSFSHINPKYVLFHVYQRMRLYGFESIHQYIERLVSDQKEIKRLVKRVSLKNAFFFNDLRSLRVVAKTIIPSLVKEYGPEHELRIWVPRCSTGEDVLSLSMLIHEHSESLQTSTKAKFICSDENEEYLQFAQKPTYSPQGLSSIPNILKEKFFSLHEGMYTFDAGYQGQCTYLQPDSIDEAPPKNVNIIYCKDVFSTLAQEAKKTLLKQFKDALAPQGILVVGSGEAGHADLPFFVPVKNQPFIYKPIQATISEPSQPQSINLFKNQAGIPKLARKKQAPAFDTTPQPGLPGTHTPDSSMNTLHKDLLLQIQAPVSLMIRPDFTIVDQIGNIGRFLAWPNNGHTENMLEAFPKEVREDLRFAVNQVIKSKIALKSRPISTKYESIFREFRLQVHPINLDEAENSLIQVIFLETDSSVAKHTPLPQPEEPSPTEELQGLKEQLKENQEKLKIVSGLLKDSKELLKQSQSREKAAKKEASDAIQQNTNEEQEKVIRQNNELRSTNTELLELNRDLVRRIEELRKNMNRKLKEIEAERKATRGPNEDDKAPSPINKNLELLLPKRHEVRTSLTSIIGFADLLADRIVDKDNRELARYIGNSGHRLSENLAPLLNLDLPEGESPEDERGEETILTSEDIVSSNRVLVVEDSDATRRLLTLVLSDKFECEVAADGSEAIKKAEKEIFKAVLLDIDLGKGPNGLDVLDHLRQKNYYRTVPFMAVTSMATPQDRSMLLRKGFDAFVPKPFQKGLLLSTLDKMIDNSAGFA